MKFISNLFLICVFLIFYNKSTVIITFKIKFSKSNYNFNTYNKINKLFIYKEDDKEESDNKKECDCKDDDKNDWKINICERSCGEFCNENEDVKTVCKMRCDKNLCSVVDKQCDITEDNGISPCDFNEKKGGL